MRTTFTLLVGALMVLSVAAPPAAAGATPAPTPSSVATDVPVASPGDDVAQDDNETHPPDPESDRLGWENGYWHNETITVDRSDGLNESELEKVVARGMARVEEVRKLEFEETVPVEVISREEFREDTKERYANTTERDRLHQNVKWEAMFMIDESRDAIAVQRQNSASGTLGYYSPTEERIVIVSENTTAPKMNEITLSQELFHALQDQKFDLSGYDQSTEELHNAKDGIIEGDGNFVDHLYEQRCLGNGSWNGTCLMPQSSGGGGGDRHIGLLINTLQPYSDGPVFVQEIYNESGWEGVNAVYENPPASTEQTIHTEKYPDEKPSTVTIDHRTRGEWHILEMGPGAIDYAQFGEAGLYSMLWYPSYVESANAGAARTVVVPYNSFFTTETAIDLYNYSHPATTGWDGDRLQPYVTDDSAETNETGYVWKVSWDSQADAEEFASAYRELLSHHGATESGVFDGVYHIPDGQEFGDAYSVTVRGDTVHIVNAPSLTDLRKVHYGTAIFGPAIEDRPDCGQGSAYSPIMGGCVEGNLPKKTGN